jgi:hypothetical protein
MRQTASLDTNLALRIEFLRSLGPVYAASTPKCVYTGMSGIGPGVCAMGPAWLMDRLPARLLIGLMVWGHCASLGTICRLGSGSIRRVWGSLIDPGW